MLIYAFFCVLFHRLTLNDLTQLFTAFLYINPKPLTTSLVRITHLFNFNNRILHSVFLSELRDDILDGYDR